MVQAIMKHQNSAGGNDSAQNQNQTNTPGANNRFEERRFTEQVESRSQIGGAQGVGVGVIIDTSINDRQ